MHSIFFLHLTDLSFIRQRNVISGLGKCEYYSRCFIICKR